MATIGQVSSGTNGIVFIDDDGSKVRFYIKCTNPATNVFGASWNGFVNGVNVSGTFDFNSGADTILVAEYNVNSNQTVSFTMGNTGTSGLGGPATATGNVNRTTIPSAPHSLSWSNILVRTARLNWQPPISDGGLAIDYYLVRIGKSNPPENGPYYDYVPTGPSPRDVINLDPATRYYARVYAHNPNGYSPGSDVIILDTFAPHRYKSAGVYRKSVPWIKINGEYRKYISFYKYLGVYRGTK